MSRKELRLLVWEVRELTYQQKIVLLAIVEIAKHEPDGWTIRRNDMESLRTLSDVPEGTSIQTSLKTLVDKGYLLRLGERKNWMYVIREELENATEHRKHVGS